MAEVSSTAAVGAAATMPLAWVAPLIGIEPQAIFWAFVGACIGLSIAAETTRGKAAIVFVFVVLFAALAGTLLSHAYWADDRLWRNGLASIMGILFHYIIAAALAHLGPLFKGIATKFGARYD